MLQYCSSEKKLVKLLYQNQAQFFFLEITKGDHKLSRTFYFMKVS